MDPALLHPGQRQGIGVCVCVFEIGEGVCMYRACGWVYVCVGVGRGCRCLLAFSKRDLHHTMHTHNSATQSTWSVPTRSPPFKVRLPSCVCLCVPSLRLEGQGGARHVVVRQSPSNLCTYIKQQQTGEMRNYDCDDGPHSPHHPDSLYDPYRDKNCEKTGPAAETCVSLIRVCVFYRVSKVE